MKRLLVRRGAAGLALGALAATGLASIPTAAHAAVAYATVGGSAYSGSDYYDDNTDTWVDCDESGVLDADETAPWSDNGVPVSRGYSMAGTYTDPANTVDKVNVSASGSATVSSTPFTGGGTPTTITGTAQATAAAISQGATTRCDTYVSSQSGAQGELVLTQPVWVTLTVSGNGNGGGFIQLGGSDGGAYVGVGKRGTASASALLSPGEVNFSFNASVGASAEGTAEGTSSYSGTFKIELQPVGSASAISGKGKAYTQFGARDCATGNVTAAITKKAKKKAKQIVVSVNGKKAVKLKGKKLKKRALVLPAAPSSAAEVTAKITLKNGKKVTVTRSYLACS
ncbi:hypothetical protein [Nocardioides humi]|uniref:Uncharacterized protein n=1 Tax=Nocardioides humi TaxID=449461 RepID=A0ABN2BI58_9ACTN|nr:hypothetical protein [Nocardioides humi]